MNPVAEKFLDRLDRLAGRDRLDRRSGPERSAPRRSDGAQTPASSPPPGTQARPGVSGRMSTGQLINGLLLDTRNLLAGEIALARAELRDAVGRLRHGALALAGGAVMLLCGIGVLAAAAVIGLAGVMQPWLAALLVGAILCAIGGAFVYQGLSRFSVQALVPDRTLRAMQKDAQALKRSLS